MTPIDWFADKIDDIINDGLRERVELLKEEAKKMERQEHGKTWDKALDTYEERGGNYVRAWEDFDDYYAETYGNKESGVLTEGSGEVGEKGGAVNKGSDDQVPDVRKMVDVIKWIDEEILLNPHYADSPRLREGANMVKVKLQQYTPTSSQTEISDEEIEKAGEFIFENEGKNIYNHYNTVPSWVEGAKWYREQLKSRQ